MANSIHNIAVISFPRTASKALVRWYGKQLNKPIALGSLHHPTHMGTNDYNIREIVFAESHILHGHWHSLNLLDDDILDCLKNNYKIVTSYYPQHLTYDNFLNVTKTTDSKLFDSVMEKTIEERKKWDIWKSHIVDGDNVETVQGPPEGYC